jgi:hypothetical protein
MSLLNRNRPPEPTVARVFIAANYQGDDGRAVAKSGVTVMAHPDAERTPVALAGYVRSIDVWVVQGTPSQTAKFGKVTGAQQGLPYAGGDFTRLLVGQAAEEILPEDRLETDSPRGPLAVACQTASEAMEESRKVDRLLDKIRVEYEASPDSAQAEDIYPFTDQDPGVLGIKRYNGDGRYRLLRNPKFPAAVRAAVNGEEVFVSYPGSDIKDQIVCSPQELARAWVDQRKMTTGIEGYPEE